MEKEKSLAEIWAKAIPRLRHDRLNNCFRYSGAIVGGIITGTMPHSVLSVSGQVALAMGGIWAGLLGFVIAGYTIFTTMNPQFMGVLADIEESHSKYSHLKVRLLVFTQLFIVMLFGLTSFIGIYLLALIYPLYQLNLPEKLKFVAHISLGATLGGSITAGLTEIKILVFNLYDLTLTQVEIQKLSNTND